jgi:hypothetical protein
MFVWRGDTILRHNPAGRPVFDWLMVLPFLAGLGWCLKNWRRPAAMVLLLWTAVMLGPTILAADTPHFLRASGLLPGIVFLPAIGLVQLWQWNRAPLRPRQSAVIILAAGSLLMTVKDYVAYGRSPDTGYLFETAAIDLAGQINDEKNGTAVFIDERFWSGWPSLPFLVNESQINLFQSETGLLRTSPPFTIYAWPYGPLDFVAAEIPANTMITVESGSLARGDLEPEPYALYVRYAVQPRPYPAPPLANFDNQYLLQRANKTIPAFKELIVELIWEKIENDDSNHKVFIHIIGPDGLIGQDDVSIGTDYWPQSWWQPGQMVGESHRIQLTEAYDPARHQIIVGLYNDQTGNRLPILNTAHEVIGDSWEMKMEE